MQHEAASGTAGLAAFDMTYQKCWLIFGKCERGEINVWDINHLPISFYSHPEIIS